MEGPQDPPFKFFSRSGSRLGIILGGMKGSALSAIASILMLVQCVKALFIKRQLALSTLQSRRRLLNCFELVLHEYVWYRHLFICFSFRVAISVYCMVNSISYIVLFILGGQTWCPTGWRVAPLLASRFVSLQQVGVAGRE